MTASTGPAVPTIAVVIVNYRTPELTVAALEAIAVSRDAFPTLTAIVVDGGSPDDSAARLGAVIATPRWRDWVTFLPLAVNGGFGWANNQAMLRLADTDPQMDYIYLVNPDARVEPDAIARLVDAFGQHPNAGAIGSLLIDDDGSPSGSAFRFPSPGREFLRGCRVHALGRLMGIKPTLVVADTIVEADWVTGAAVMFRTRALAETGLFDSGFFLYFEEVELMWRLRKAGWQVLHQPASRVWHVGGAATGLTYNQKDVMLAPPLPDYWFASRLRMLALTRGRLVGTLASMSWLAGHGGLMALRLVGLKRGERLNRDEARTLIRHGMIPTDRDRTAAIVRFGDVPETPPAWMDRQG